MAVTGGEDTAGTFTGEKEFSSSGDRLLYVVDIVEFELPNDVGGLHHFLDEFKLAVFVAVIHNEPLLCFGRLDGDFFVAELSMFGHCTHQRH